MRPITALLLADDRPGHYHLSDGIIAAARRIRPVEVARVSVHRLWPGRVLALLSNAGVSPDWLLRAAYGLNPAALPRADLVVSAGAETLAANVAAARRADAPNIFYGSVRAFRPESFTLVLTSYAEHADRPRHEMVLKPSGLGHLAPAADRPTLPPGSSPREAGLLIGGDSGECRYAPADWDALIAFLDSAHAGLGVRWHVSNSRRTPDAVSDRLARRAADGESSIAQLVDVRTNGPGTLGRILARAEAIVCTDDSSSMISECIGARLPVLGVRPHHQRLSAEEQGYRQYLAANGWYRSLAIADLSPDRFTHELSAVHPPREDPLERLVVILRKQLPALFAL